MKLFFQYIMYNVQIFHIHSEILIFLMLVLKHMLFSYYTQVLVSALVGVTHITLIDERPTELHILAYFQFFTDIILLLINCDRNIKIV